MVFCNKLHCILNSTLNNIAFHGITILHYCVIDCSVSTVYEDYLIQKGWVVILSELNSGTKMKTHTHLNWIAEYFCFQVSSDEQTNWHWQHFFIVLPFSILFFTQSNQCNQTKNERIKSWDKVTRERIGIPVMTLLFIMQDTKIDSHHPRVNGYLRMIRKLAVDTAYS